MSREAVRRFRRNRPAMFGLAILLALALFAIVGPIVAPFDPDASDFSLNVDGIGPPGPSATHWFGTDSLYRDLFTRLAYGARLSLAIAVAATVLTTAIGTLVGVTAGITAGTRLRAVDAVLMRLVDILLALPFLLFVTAIGAAVGRADVGTLLAVLGLTGWTGTARLVRAKTLQVRELEFVMAARALGARSLAIVRRHILPNVAGPLIVIATASIAQMILAEAVLGYLTLGVQPPRATWGRMLHEAEPLLSTRPAVVAAPGFAILLAVLGCNRVGDGLRDAIDPGNAGRLPARRSLPVDLLISAAAILLFAIASPGPVRGPIGTETSAVEPTRGGVLHLATFVGIRTLDAALAYDDGAIAVQELVYARLVTWDPQGRIVPDLASEVIESPDFRSYTFVLREGVKFHDGAELGAADVKRSIERTLAPKTPSPAASHYAMIAGFDDFRAGRAPHLSGVRVLGDRTVAIDLREPDATFLPLMTLAFAAPVCPSSGATVDSRRPAQPCGAGPFRIASWDPDTSIVLTRHEGYFRPGKPYLDGIEWLLNVRPATQRYKFEDGQLDYVRDLTGAEGRLYRAHPAWSRRGRWTSRKGTNAIFLNTELAPFDIPAMRRAVAFAVDPSVLQKVRPDVLPLDRVLPDSIPGPDRTEPMRRHDPLAALAELARAGYPYDPVTRTGGYPHEIEYLTVPDSFEQQAAEVFQQQLARVGIRIRLRLASFSTYLADASRRRTTTMGWAGWSPDFPDPSSVFEPTLSSRAIQDEGSQNHAFFAHAELDSVLDRARREQNREQRFALYARAEAIVRDEAPWVPAYVSRVFELWQPNVRGYAPHAVISQRFADVWLDPNARTIAAAASLTPLLPHASAQASLPGTNP